MVQCAQMFYWGVWMRSDSMQMLKLFQKIYLIQTPKSIQIEPPIGMDSIRTNSGLKMHLHMWRKYPINVNWFRCILFMLLRFTWVNLMLWISVGWFSKHWVFAQVISLITYLNPLLVKSSVFHQVLTISSQLILGTLVCFTICPVKCLRQN